MIERVARAMEPHLFQYDDYVVGPATRHARAEALRKAQAALSAITPPNGDEAREALEEARKYVLPISAGISILPNATAVSDAQHLLFKIDAALAKEKRG